jgi:23S rRNA (guanosine2251-2'-O)-methyltransferase
VFCGGEKSGKSASETVLTGPSVLVLGSEDKGISREIIALADNQIKIPMTGTIESLNVSVAAGILLYEITRQRSV